MAVDAFISVLIQVLMRTACSVLTERSFVPLFPGLKLILVCVWIIAEAAPFIRTVFLSTDGHSGSHITGQSQTRVKF